MIIVHTPPGHPPSPARVPSTPEPATATRPTRGADDFPGGCVWWNDLPSHDSNGSLSITFTYNNTSSMVHIERRGRSRGVGDPAAPPCHCSRHSCHHDNEQSQDHPHSDTSCWCWYDHCFCFCYCCHKPDATRAPTSCCHSDSRRRDSDHHPTTPDHCHTPPSDHAASSDHHSATSRTPTATCTSTTRCR